MIKKETPLTLYGMHFLMEMAKNTEHTVAFPAQNSMQCTVQSIYA